MSPRSSQTFQAVIFDLDQVLVDSHQALAEVWASWLAEYRIPPDASVNWGGWTSEAIVRLCLPDEDVAAGLERIEALETSTTHGIVALPSAARALAELPAERVAVGTSGSRPVARARLAAAGLEAPATLVSASDVTDGKPAPDIFLEAARRLGVAPGDCLVVEDAPAGLEAARAAGMATLAVLTSTPSEELEADEFVTDLSEVEWQVTPAGIQLH